MNRGQRGVGTIHSKLILDLTASRTDREVSVAVGLEDFFLCRCIFGLRIPSTKYRSVFLVRNTLKKPT